MNDLLVFFGIAETNAVLFAFVSVTLWLMLPLPITLFSVIPFLLAFYFGCRYFAAGHLNRSSPSLVGRVCIVTGSLGGIGLITAVELAKLGATVVVAARGDQKRIETAIKSMTQQVKSQFRARADIAQPGVLLPLQLDLSSFASIHQFVEQFNARFDRLHLLINNAGIMMCPFQKTVDGLELQMGTNHYGHYLLTRLLLPRLLSSAPHARVVNVASLAHAFAPNGITEPLMSKQQTYQPTKAYADSKLANILFTTQFEAIYGSQGVHAYSLHPGSINTDLVRHFPSFLLLLAKPLFHLLLKSPYEGAQTTLHCALSPHAVPGAYHTDCTLVDRCTRIAKDQQLAQQFWMHSQQVCKLKPSHNTKQ